MSGLSLAARSQGDPPDPEAPDSNGPDSKGPDSKGPGVSGLPAVLRALSSLGALLALGAAVVFTSPALVRYSAIASHGSAAVDRAGATDSRLQPLREALPGEGPLGWVTDRNDVEHFYQAQYALAPRLLIPAEPVSGLDLTPEPRDVNRWAGAFESEAELAATTGRLGLRVEQALGNGLYVLERMPGS